jgi:oxygen-independent coproporphyrinogen-3 oxidase
MNLCESNGTSTLPDGRGSARGQHGSQPTEPRPSGSVTTCEPANTSAKIDLAALTTAAAPAPPLEKQTAPGNYFVANYPPFSFWRPQFVGQALEALGRPPRPDKPLGVYVHIPFCRKRCHFCYFRVYTDKDSAAIRSYLEAVLREMELYSQRAFIGGRQPEFIYFGGGTPSYLSADQLRVLTGGLKSFLPWTAAREVTFECEPGTLTDHKLGVIHELGVTRLSLGIESFKDEILELNGRAHRSREIQRAYAYARQVGFPQINIDLIAGMMGETDENWRDTVRQAIDLQADSVTIYQMEVPFNTTIYQQMKTEGRLAAPVADWEKKRAWVGLAFAELEGAGYTVASAYTAVKDPARAKFLYRDRLWEGADLLGLGVASFSHIGGTHFQNEHDFDPYLARLRRNELPICRALTPTEEERVVRELVLQFKLGRVRPSYFRGKFGVELARQFAGPLARLRAWGCLETEADALVLNREGLLQVDGLIHEFFLPQHRNARYA